MKAEREEGKPRGKEPGSFMNARSNAEKGREGSLLGENEIERTAEPHGKELLEREGYMREREEKNCGTSGG